MTNATLKSGFVRVALCASFGAMACAVFADGKVDVDFSRGLVVIFR